MENWGLRLKESAFYGQFLSQLYVKAKINNTLLLTDIYLTIL